MAKFITLSLDNSDEEVIVNADHIVKFGRRPGVTYTVVEFENLDQRINVKDSPEDIGRKVRS